MLRFGLCCLFKNEPIKFKRITAKYLKQFRRSEQLLYLSNIIKHNAESLNKALIFCNCTDIGSFRVNSQILPLKTHPEIGYEIEELPDSKSITKMFKNCGEYANKNNIRTTLHPDQFILLSSPIDSVTNNSIMELENQAGIAEVINADIINIHAGGAYGNKNEALKRCMKRIERLPYNIRKLLTLENDDKIYTPADLLPLCRKMNLPLVYDVHHHRCLEEKPDIENTTEMVLKTWNREAVFHISSPKYGWENNKKRLHSDYIAIADFPSCWRNMDITVEVEAKYKELAVLKLMEDVNNLK